MARLTWHGHSCFTLATRRGQRIMFDPWLDENPMADIGVEEVGELDYVLVSHGHFDHFADGVRVATRTGATMVGTFELVTFANSRGVEKVHGMNIGGGYRFPFGYTKLTPALHSGTVAGDDEGKFTSTPAGFLLQLEEGNLYHAGDTALITDMQLLSGRVDIALLPIGDNFTMGPQDAVRALEMIRPRVVIPMHYNTFEVIQQDPSEFADQVGDFAEVVVLQPGETYEF